jgi:predicted phage terminase large subunit-like protein
MKFEKIKSIEYLEELPECTYNIEIKDNHNYYAGGILVKNCDDPQNPKTSESEVYRKQTIDYYEQSLYNRLTPVNLGVRVLVQQRLHANDLSARLLEKNPDKYTHICLPAEVSDNVSPAHLKEFYKDGLLDPIRLSRKTLDDFKSTLGSRGYAGQYSQIPTPDEGGIIKPHWFEIVEPATIVRDPINEPIHFFIDSAYTEKTENDPTAILVCFKKGNILYVLDVVEVWKEFPDLIKFIKEYTSKFQYNPLYSKLSVEPKSSGKSIVQVLRAESNLNVVELAPPEKDKITRAHSITATLEGLRVKLVKGNYTEKFLDQLKAFPNGKHDDMVDVLVYAVSELLLNDNPDWFFV